MTLGPEFRKGLGLAALVLLIDQITKWWIVSSVMDPPRVIEVTPFFNLVMAWNQGSARRAPRRTRAADHREKRRAN